MIATIEGSLTPQILWNIFHRCLIWKNSGFFDTKFSFAVEVKICVFNLDENRWKWIRNSDPSRLSNILKALLWTLWDRFWSLLCTYCRRSLVGRVTPKNWNRDWILSTCSEEGSQNLVHLNTVAGYIYKYCLNKLRYFTKFFGFGKSLVVAVNLLV